MLRVMQRGQQFTTIFPIVMAITVLGACQPLLPEPDAPATEQPAQTAIAPTPALTQLTTPDDEASVQETGEHDDTGAVEVPPPPSKPENLWERLRSLFALDHRLDHPRVQAEIRWYQKHPDYIARVSQRATPHLHYIVERIEDEGLPGELALLPVIESAFDPFAYSHGRAAGIWQIIPGTARHLGLKTDYWYEGRRDIPDATGAALRYLTALHQSLDQDWLLALAAYNNGEGNVRRAMRRNRQQGRPETFFDLKLHRETTGYVPRLLAISAVVASPEQYGLVLPPVPNTPHWVMVDIEGQIDVATAAGLMDITTEDLYRLNPGLNQWSTPPSGPHRLLVPVNRVSRLLDGLNSLAPQERIAWRRHVVASGETLGDIALTHDTTVRTLQQSNGINDHIIVPGQSLLIPVAKASDDTYGLTQSERLKRTQSRLQKEHGIPHRHTVVPGDTLWDLSMAYGVGVRSLAKWNGKAPRDLIIPGDVLLVFGAQNVQTDSMASTPAVQPVQAVEPQESQPTVAVPPGERNVVRKVNYRVRSGESLAMIANRFRVTVQGILEWNQHLADRRYIHPGDPITLYVDVTSAH